MLGTIVRFSPAPVIARICAWSSITASTSIGDRDSSSMPGAARSAVPSTICAQPAASIAAAQIAASRPGRCGHGVDSLLFRRLTRGARVANSVGQVTESDLAPGVRGFAAGTGIGSWPGTSAREAAEIVVGELHRLPHLVELPARGIGADLIGRAGALLVDITIDTVPRGYRVASGRSAVTRRAASLLAEDVDALEEAWEKAGLRGTQRTVKVQAPRADHARGAIGTRPTGTGRSPIPAPYVTWPDRWPRASPFIAPKSPAGWTARWSSNSTNRRCPRRCRADSPA